MSTTRRLAQLAVLGTVVVDTIAELAALTLFEPTTRAITRGKYTLGDGMGQVWRYEPGTFPTDDDFYVPSDAGGTWVAVFMRERFWVSAAQVDAPTAGQVLCNIIAPEEGFFLPQYLVGSNGFAATAPADGDVVFPIYHHPLSNPTGTLIGDITWSQASVDANFTFANKVKFDNGQRLVVLAPAIPDSAFAQFTFTLAGYTGATTAG